MANAAETIEAVWAAHVAGIDGIRTVRDHEPGQIDRKLLPMLTMFFLLPQGHMTATGPTEDVDYRWEISLYVSLSDWKTAQAQMRDLATLVVENFRRHRGDYDLAPDFDLFARTLTRRNPPTPDESEMYLRASWELQVTAGEA